MRLLVFGTSFCDVVGNTMPGVRCPCFLKVRQSFDAHIRELALLGGRKSAMFASFSECAKRLLNTRCLFRGPEGVFERHAG